MTPTEREIANHRAWLELWHLIFGLAGIGLLLAAAITGLLWLLVPMFAALIFAWVCSEAAG